VAALGALGERLQGGRVYHAPRIVTQSLEDPVEVASGVVLAAPVAALPPEFC
jgi:hypothetical protein